MSGKGFYERIMPKLRKMDPESMRNCVRHLARETGFLENIFNTIGEAVLVIDDSLRIVYHNAAAQNKRKTEKSASKPGRNYFRFRGRQGATVRPGRIL